jgi:signal transduction histidine kinase/CheY-like chemotaxis protein
MVGRQVERLIGTMSRWEHGDYGARASLAPWGSTLGRLGAAFDGMAASLQDRERLHDVAHSAERRMAQVLSSTTDAVLEIDRSGAVTFMNDRARTIAAGGADPIGRPLAEVLPDAAGPGFSIPLGQALDADVPVEFEARFPGTGRRFGVRAFPSPAGLALYLQDVTARHAAECALIAAKEEAEATRAEAERAVASKSRFLAAASHDLRQPVQSLVLFASLLSEQVQGHEASPIVEAMGRSLGTLSTLIEQLLDVSRLEAGTIEPRVGDVALAPLMERLALEYGLQARARGLDFRVVPTAATVRTDPALLERILRNLIENALRYTRDGRVLLGARRQGGSIRLEVLDQGPGIPPDQLDAIFEEFHQVPGDAAERAAGLGLGLAIVRRLTRLLGHEVALRSRLGSGSGFSVMLSRAQATPGRAPSPGRAPAATRQGIALVVEDEASVRQGLRLVLESWGWDVLEAGSAAEAVERARATCPDVILADYRLGEGATGPEAIRLVGEACGGAVPAVVLTADTAPEREREIRARGLAVVHKPLAAVELRRAIDALGRQAGRNRPMPAP